jgi:hypothetical protein
MLIVLTGDEPSSKMKPDDRFGGATRTVSVLTRKGDALADISSKVNEFLEEGFSRIGDMEVLRVAIWSVVSASRSRVGTADLLTNCAVVNDGSCGLNELMTVIDSEARRPSVASALVTFQFELAEGSRSPGGRSPERARSCCGCERHCCGRTPVG